VSRLWSFAAQELRERLCDRDPLLAPALRPTGHPPAELALDARTRRQVRCVNVVHRAPCTPSLYGCHISGLDATSEVSAGRRTLRLAGRGVIRGVTLRGNLEVGMRGAVLLVNVTLHTSFVKVSHLGLTLVDCDVRVTKPEGDAGECGFLVTDYGQLTLRGCTVRCEKEAAIVAKHPRRVHLWDTDVVVHRATPGTPSYALQCHHWRCVSEFIIECCSFTGCGVQLVAFPHAKEVVMDAVDFDDTRDQVALLVFGHGEVRLTGVRFHGPHSDTWPAVSACSVPRPDCRLTVVLDGDTLGLPCEEVNGARVRFANAYGGSGEV